MRSNRFRRNMAPSICSMLERQYACILERTKSLNPGFVGIVIPHPTKLAGLGNGTYCMPGFSNHPIKEVPRAPFEGFGVPSVLCNYALPNFLIVLGPLNHREIIGHPLAFSVRFPFNLLRNLGMDVSCHVSYWRALFMTRLTFTPKYCASLGQKYCHTNTSPLVWLNASFFV